MRTRIDGRFITVSSNHQPAGNRSVSQQCCPPITCEPGILRLSRASTPLSCVITSALLSYSWRVRTASPKVASPSSSETSAALLKGRSRTRFVRYAIPAILLFIYIAQCAWFIRTQSLTYDEPSHVYAGLDAWRNGRFLLWNDHPSL